MGNKMKFIHKKRFGNLLAVRPTPRRSGTSVIWECLCDCGNTAFVAALNLTKGRTKSCGCIRHKNSKDLTGQRFGKLVAIRPTEKRSNRHVVWECLCDCGNTTLVAATNLAAGNAKSCGCNKRGNFQNLTKQRFGKLVAIRPTKMRSGTGVVWECICDCGNIAFAAAQNLRSGNKKSCGCIRRGSFQDLTGQRFSNLVAIQPTEKRCGTSIIWECKCDCGNTAFVSSHNLRRGKKRSCGCKRRGLQTA